MKYPVTNIFAAWFFIVETLATGWVAYAGNLLLQMLGVPTMEGFIPGRLVGALLLILVIYLVWHFMRGLPPQGKPEGNGYRFGHRLIFAANIMAFLLYLFLFFEPGITDHNTHLILDEFTNAFGYLALGCFAAGFSFVYQSSLPEAQEKKQS